MAKISWPSQEGARFCAMQPTVSDVGLLISSVRVFGHPHTVRNTILGDSNQANNSVDISHFSEVILKSKPPKFSVIEVEIENKQSGAYPLLLSFEFDENPSKLNKTFEFEAAPSGFSTQVIYVSEIV